MKRCPSLGPPFFTVLQTTKTGSRTCQVVTSLQWLRSVSGRASEPFTEDAGGFDETAAFLRKQHARDRAAQLGSVLESHYKPSNSLLHPPNPWQVSLNTLIAAGAHLGHATALWNPANQPYIFGIRQGIHIIYLESTLAHLRRACSVLRGLCEQNGIVVFLGTRHGQQRCVEEAAKRCGGYHVFDRWIPGTITNAKQVLGTSGLGEFDDKERKRRDIDKTDGKTVLPDLVVVLNPLENRAALAECARMRVPTIGIIDTDADPACVTYPIPANDDSLRVVQMIAGVLGNAGKEGMRRRRTKS